VQGKKLALTAVRHCVCSVLALLTACAQQTELQRPALPVPQAFPGVPTGTAGRDATKTHWTAFFPDPRLQALITTALEYNRDLRMAAGRVQEARAQYGLARAERLPLVNLNAQAAVQRSPPSISGVDASSNTNRFDLSVSTISYELDFWGRLASLTDAARNTYLATEEARRSVYLSLIADVATAYFAQLQLDEAAELARSTVTSREQSLALVMKGLEIGGSYDYEVQQARGALETARTSLAALEHQRNVATNQLTYLVGSLPPELPAGRSLDAQGIDNDLAPGLPGDVLLQRPDVMAAEQRLAAAHANIGAARAAFFPKVLLTAGLGFASPALATLLSGGAWNFQPMISMPLFDGGRNAANQDVAEARKVIAVADYEKTIQIAFREVSDQLSARQSLESQLRSSKANMQAQDRRLVIAQARFNAGMVGYLDVLDAQRDLVGAQQSFIQIRRARLDAAAQLYKALGGGTQAAAA